jgi:hypothetical protein
MILLGWFSNVRHETVLMAGIPYFRPAEVLSGSIAVWGIPPVIDGIRVTPPVQVGVPRVFVEDFSSRYIEKDLIVREAFGSRFVLTKRHIVLAVEAYQEVGVWSYELECHMHNGGNVLCSQFTGNWRYCDRSQPAMVALGMTVGCSGWGVGQFGSLFRPVGTQIITITKPEYNVSVREPFSGIPASVTRVRRDNDEWEYSEWKHLWTGGMVSGSLYVKKAVQDFNFAKNQVDSHPFYGGIVGEGSDSDEDACSDMMAAIENLKRRDAEFARCCKDEKEAQDFLTFRSKVFSEKAKCAIGGAVPGPLGLQVQREVLAKGVRNNVFRVETGAPFAPNAAIIRFEDGCEVEIIARTVKSSATAAETKKNEDHIRYMISYLFVHAITNYHAEAGVDSDRIMNAAAVGNVADASAVAEQVVDSNAFVAADVPGPGQPTVVSGLLDEHGNPLSLHDPRRALLRDLRKEWVEKNLKK